MFALSGLALAALGVLAALIVYGLAWRATSGRSTGVQVLVRGGLLLLIAVPVAGMLLLSPAMRGSADAASRSSHRRCRTNCCARRSAMCAARRRDRVPIGPAATASQAAADRGPRPETYSLGRRRRFPLRGRRPPPPRTAQETSWDLVPVFFGTDRGAARPQAPAVQRRARAPARARPRHGDGAEEPRGAEHRAAVGDEDPLFRRDDLRGGGGPDKHFTMQEIKKLPRRTSWRWRASASPRRTATRITPSSSCTATTRRSIMRSTARRRSPTT